jgi:hypothetical protein
MYLNAWWAREDSNLQPDRYERWPHFRLPCFIGIFVEVEAIRSAPKRSNLGRNWGGNLSPPQVANVIVRRRANCRKLSASKTAPRVAGASQSAWPSATMQAHLPAIIHAT